ncbi:MAG TPA: WYL domain-containing protein [Arachidicoccus sp.]|nr:WYL domain-containing protein [Arachidicoccus sp.]
MSLNKLALIRFKILDDCLANRLRRWTLDDLVLKVSDVLLDREGVATGISKRTIQSDLQIMRSDKLGYNAPIEVIERKYYRYSDPGFTINRAPLNAKDIILFKEAIELLKQLNGFQQLEDLTEMIARLENNLHTGIQQQPGYIQFEHNHLLRGLNYIQPLYQSIKNATAIQVEYRSFKAKTAHLAIYYPYLLKEFRNRWFLICRCKDGQGLLNLALDRMLDVSVVPSEPFVPYQGIAFETYYNDLIGVTKSPKDRARKVILEIARRHAPYIMTKPLHSSQIVLEGNGEWIRIRIDVVLNFELEREILSFGAGLRVIYPRDLAARIKKEVDASAAMYEVPVKGS